MTATSPGRETYRLGPGLPVLVLAALALTVVSDWPILIGSLLVAVGVAVGVVVRWEAGPRARALSVVPVLVALVALGARTPVGAVPDGLAGVAGVAVIVWLADDPHRPRERPSRWFSAWSIPVIGVAIAWASTALLPPTAVPFGVAGGLLAAALIALAVLVRRPDLVDRDRAPSL